MNHVLVIDDHSQNTHLIEVLLRSERYIVTTSSSPSGAVALLCSTSFNLIFLEAMMPSMNALELCHWIRRTSTTPIILLSVRADIQDKVAGLRAGADDYITKPYDSSELLARAEALIRRHASHTRLDSSSVVMTSDILLDSVHSRVTLARTGKTIDLTPVERSLLHYLISNPGCSLSREELSAKVWGSKPQHTSNEVDVYIKRLRRKIEEEPSQPKLLLTVRGIGYKFQPSEGYAIDRRPTRSGARPEWREPNPSAPNVVASTTVDRDRYA